MVDTDNFILSARESMVTEKTQRKHLLQGELAQNESIEHFSSTRSAKFSLEASESQITKRNHSETKEKRRNKGNKREYAEKNSPKKDEGKLEAFTRTFRGFREMDDFSKTMTSRYKKDDQLVDIDSFHLESSIQSPTSNWSKIKKSMTIGNKLQIPSQKNTWVQSNTSERSILKSQNSQNISNFSEYFNFTKKPLKKHLTRLDSIDSEGLFGVGEINLKEQAASGTNWKATKTPREMGSYSSSKNDLDKGSPNQSALMRFKILSPGLKSVQSKVSLESPLKRMLTTKSKTQIPSLRLIDDSFQRKAEKLIQLTNVFKGFFQSSSSRNFFREMSMLTSGLHSGIMRIFFDSERFRSDLDVDTLSCILNPRIKSSSFDVCFMRTNGQLIKSSMSAYNTSSEKHFYRGVVRATNKVFSLSIFLNLREYDWSETPIQWSLDKYLEAIQERITQTKMKSFDELERTFKGTKKSLREKMTTTFQKGVHVDEEFLRNGRIIQKGENVIGLYKGIPEIKQQNGKGVLMEIMEVNARATELEKLIDESMSFI